VTRDEAARRLGVAVDALPEAVERAFRQRARTLHPDAGGDAVAFRSLVEARSTLVAYDPRRFDSPVVVTTRRTRFTAGLARRRRQVLTKLGRAEPRVQ